MKTQSALSATSLYQKEGFTMEEFPVTPVEPSSEETPREKSFLSAKEKVNAE